MKLRFAKLDPTGNTTILVQTPVPRLEQPHIARALMANENLCAEQVGFIESPTLPGARARLQMEGGEFCGNASMSMAALLALQDGMPAGGEALYSLEVSGAEGPVPCRIQRAGEATFFGTVSMPLPESAGEVETGAGRFPLVRLPGIAHAIVPQDAITPAEAEACIAALCAGLDLDALGILLMSPDGTHMRPLVYVKNANVTVWEHGCGSGSAALAAFSALRAERDVNMSIQQPGGVITARAAYDGGAVRKIEIQGKVRLVAQGEAYV